MILRLNMSPKTQRKPTEKVLNLNSQQLLSKLKSAYGWRSAKYSTIKLSGLSVKPESFKGIKIKYIKK